MNKNRNFIKKAHARALFIIVSLMTVLFFYAMAMGHGGKDHAAGEFTPLMALQEATKLYDRLVSGGKLKVNTNTESLDCKFMVFVLMYHVRRFLFKTYPKTQQERLVKGATIELVNE